MSGSIYCYDSSKNEVVEMYQDISFENFKTHKGIPHQFWIGERTDDKMEIHSSDGESILLQADRQTRHQAVVLFAVMLGIRETARE